MVRALADLIARRNSQSRVASVGLIAGSLFRLALAIVGRVSRGHFGFVLIQHRLRFCDGLNERADFADARRTLAGKLDTLAQVAAAMR